MGVHHTGIHELTACIQDFAASRIQVFPQPNNPIAFNQDIRVKEHRILWIAGDYGARIADDNPVFHPFLLLIFSSVP
jgi:hypothetical protein